MSEFRSRLTAHGKSLRQALEFYCDHLDRIQSSLPIHEVRDQLIRRVRAEGKSRRHIDDLESRLGVFLNDFGDRMTASVTRQEINEWLTSLQLAPTTVINYRRILHNLFSEAVRMDAAPSNSVTHAIKPKTHRGRGVSASSPSPRPTLSYATWPLTPSPPPPSAFSPASDGPEVERLDWPDTDLEEGHIIVPATKTKSARRRLVKIQSCLQAILKSVAQNKGPIIASTWTYRSRLQEAIGAAGIDCWPPNALRHSFASYHLAHFNDAGQLALESGHTDTRVIFQHYRQLVKPKEAEKFWAYRPA